MYAITLFGSDVFKEFGRESLVARYASGGEPQSSRFWSRPGAQSAMFALDKNGYEHTRNKCHQGILVCAKTLHGVAEEHDLSETSIT